MRADPFNKKHKESPLDSLVRRTSSKRTRPPPLHNNSDELRPSQGSQSQPLHSPLLHGHFARDSVATASSYERNSYIDSGNSTRTYSIASSSNAYEESIYSQPDLTLRDSWHTTTTTNTTNPDPSRLSATHNMHMDEWQSWRNGQAPQTTPSSPLPIVVISAPDHNNESEHYRTAGREPLVKPISANFSRPVRPPTNELEEQKRQVLLRNSGKQRSQSPSMMAREPSPLRQEYPRGVLPHSSPAAPFSTTISNTPQPSSHRSMKNPDGSRLQGPSLRTGSALSLYSTYSYYPYEGGEPSPVGSTFSNSGDPFAAYARPPPRLNVSQISTSSSSQSPSTAPSDLQSQFSADPSSHMTVQDYLQLGIQHHEANRLKESATCFEKSAKENGGCGVGMLMWGLTLRHGWGCEKNEKVGFKWLRRAAESAVEDLENSRAKGGVDTTAVQTELVLAIYEVGQCFFQGWGVPKDQKMAVSYYTVAAQLGDSDAQTDLAFCLANGKGCKKDKREAAKWYRAAVKQGQSDVGLAWIWKDKYKSL